MERIKKTYTTWQMSDISWKDIYLLTKAKTIPEGSWMCYGKSWGRLKQLGLVDEETMNITTTGCALLNYVNKYVRRNNDNNC